MVQKYKIPTFFISNKTFPQYNMCDDDDKSTDIFLAYDDDNIDFKYIFILIY